MMHEREKSDSAIVAVKPTNKAGASIAPLRSRWGGAKGGDQEERERAKHAPDIRAGNVCPRRSNAYGRPHLPSSTQGRSRVREIRSHGSVRGAAGNSRPYRERAESADTMPAHDPRQTLGALWRFVPGGLFSQEIKSCETVPGNVVRPKY